MDDRECTKFMDVSSFMCCGKLKCIMCYNWHRKWVHGDQFAYDCEKGVLVETKYTFYPEPDKEVVKPGYVDELAGLSDEQLMQIAENLRLKVLD